MTVTWLLHLLKRNFKHFFYRYSLLLRVIYIFTELSVQAENLLMVFEYEVSADGIFNEPFFT